MPKLPLEMGNLSRELICFSAQVQINAVTFSRHVHVLHSGWACSNLIYEHGILEDVLRGTHSRNPASN